MENSWPILQLRTKCVAAGRQQRVVDDTLLEGRAHHKCALAGLHDKLAELEDKLVRAQASPYYDADAVERIRTAIANIKSTLSRSKIR